jgi:hypothetical protein
LTLLALPSSVEAQLRVRVGGGGLVDSPTYPDWGGHVLIDATRDFGSVFGLRLGGFAGTGSSFSEDATLGTQLEMLIQWPEGSALRPYVGLGLGFTHTDASAHNPVGYDFGVTIPFGIESRRGWFVEVKPNYFGNMFYEHAVTQSLGLLTLGWRVH